MKNLNSEIETIREKLKEFFSLHRDRPEDHTQKDINDVSLPELRSAGIGYIVMLILILIIFCLLITNFTPYQ
jgi:hypothetical protein